MRKSIFILGLLMLAPFGAAAQNAMPEVSPPDSVPQNGPTQNGPTPLAPLPPVAPPHALVALSAVFAPNDPQPIRSSLDWRVFSARTESDGSHALVAESKQAEPAFSLEDGDYLVHVGCGLAGVTKPICVNGAPLRERMVLNAGGLKISGVMGEAPIPPARLAIQVYLPDHNDPEAKLIMPSLRANEIECVPEGAYHIVSKLMDVTPGAINATNSVIYADLRVQAGKLTSGVLRHRAATMTLKLVNAPGGEALANTSFSILTPGGDVIRELIGAFPSLVLAEGEYVAIARHDSKTYQATFKVQSNQDRDVEVLAQ